MYNAIVRLIGLGSIVACTIVIVSFGLFAVNQTSTASTHQQQLLNGKAAAPSGETGSPSRVPAETSHESGIRRKIDDASGWLTSPFDALTSGSHSEWAIRAVGLLFALIVYGFCAGFLARALRIRT